MGTRLAFSEPEKLIDRCAIASVRQTSGEDGYDDGCVVPCAPWRPITPDEADELRAGALSPDNVRVELIRRSLPSFTTDDEAGRLGAAANIDPLPGRWPDNLLGCTVCPGDSVTSTHDSTTGLRIGLHVDNFDRLPYPQRHEGRRRLCLNLGPGSRYLLLADQDIQQICRALGIDRPRHYPHTQDLRRYVADGRPLHCLRIRLEPGDGYIAPTELLPHDGSTGHPWLPSGSG